MSWDAFQMLDRLTQSKQALPDFAKIETSKYFTGKGANLLTSVVIKYLKWNGYFAERTSNTGQVRRMKDGSMKYTYGSGTNGTSDIKAIVNGKFIAIEVKQRDKQSEAQKKYETQVINAGGEYLIVRSLDNLLEIFDINKITKTK